jgi:uncharacterized protein
MYIQSGLTRFAVAPNVRCEDRLGRVETGGESRKARFDFAEFEAGFSWNDYAATSARPSTRTGRGRAKLIGRMHGMTVAAIVSPLGSEALAIVSLRPANLDERVRYAER